MDRYDATYPNQQVRAERAFLAWRAGEAPTVASFPTTPPNQDLHRYWLLELRLLNGEDPQRLLTDLQTIRAQFSSYQPLLEGLEGELLARLGQSAAAQTHLQSALRQARFQAAGEPNYRVHLPILEGRLATLQN